MGGRGSGGHNRKSPWQHIIEGTYRQDRHGPKPDANPLRIPDNARPPRWFSPEAKAHFKELAPKLSELGTLDRINLRLFEALCVTLGHLDKLRPLLGEKWADHLYNRYTNDALQLFRIFGMTPAARKKLHLEVNDARGKSD
jgi:phage terminase small subunit